MKLVGAFCVLAPFLAAVNAYQCQGLIGNLSPLCANGLALGGQGGISGWSNLAPQAQFYTQGPSQMQYWTSSTFQPQCGSHWNYFNGGCVLQQGYWCPVTSGCVAPQPQCPQGYYLYGGRCYSVSCFDNRSGASVTCNLNVNVVVHVHHDRDQSTTEPPTPDITTTTTRTTTTTPTRTTTSWTPTRTTTSWTPTRTTTTTTPRTPNPDVPPLDIWGQSSLINVNHINNPIHIPLWNHNSLTIHAGGQEVSSSSSTSPEKPSLSDPLFYQKTIHDNTTSSKRVSGVSTPNIQNHNSVYSPVHINPVNENHVSIHVENHNSSNATVIEPLTNPPVPPHTNPDPDPNPPKPRPRPRHPHCCTVYSLRNCSEDWSSDWSCYHRKTRICGPRCTASVIVISIPRPYCLNHHDVGCHQTSCYHRSGCNVIDYDQFCSTEYDSSLCDY